MSLELAADAIVAILLVVTVAYCFQLNRRLTALRADQESLSGLVNDLNQATARAQEGVFQLRSVSQEAEDTLKKEVSRARALSDELSLITEAGGNLADRIESGLTEARRGQAQKTGKVAPFRLDEGPSKTTDGKTADSTAIDSASAAAGGASDLRNLLKAAR